VSATLKSKKYYKLHVNTKLNNTILKNSIIHEEKTKKITAVSVVLYVIKNHVNLHKF
jgi:hypothetical protein